MQGLLYRDALNYAPIDVRKGIDLVTRKIVSADAKAPEGYAPMPKCRMCRHYIREDDFTGVCNASMHKPKFMAYADMCAKTCEMFEIKQ